MTDLSLWTLNMNHFIGTLQLLAFGTREGRRKQNKIVRFADKRKCISYGWLMAKNWKIWKISHRCYDVLCLLSASELYFAAEFYNCLGVRGGWEKSVNFWPATKFVLLEIKMSNHLRVYLIGGRGAIRTLTVSRSIQAYSKGVEL